MQCSSVGCRLSQWKDTPLGARVQAWKKKFSFSKYLVVYFLFGGWIRSIEAAMGGEGARSVPLGVLMSPKRWVRAAHGRARTRDGGFGERWRDRRGRVWRRRVCRDYSLFKPWETCRFTVPPAVTLVNYTRSDTFCTLSSALKYLGPFASQNKNTKILILDSV